MQTGNEQFSPVFILDERAETVGDFESPPVVNFCRRVAPKHARLLHFSPKKSIAIVGVRVDPCQRLKCSEKKSYAKLSPPLRRDSISGFAHMLRAALIGLPSAGK